MRSDAAYSPVGTQPKAETEKKSCDDAYWQHTETERESSGDSFDEEAEIMAMSAPYDSEQRERESEQKREYDQYSGPESIYSEFEQESSNGSCDETEPGKNHPVLC